MSKPRHHISAATARAEQLLEELKPHCHRAAIAGSIRREKPFVGDIEIVCIPKPYEVGLFSSGVGAVLSKYQKVKGELGPKCKYTQRILYMPDGSPIKADIFFVTPENWAVQILIRTGSADFSARMASIWSRKGYESIGGMLYANGRGEPVPFEEERDVFKFLGVDWVEPRDRF